MTTLELTNFTITYPGAARPVFAQVNFSLAAGEAVALRGESGAGKSSLLLAACGLIPHSVAANTSGDLRLFGRAPGEYTLAERAGLVGMVFQSAQTQLFCGTSELEVAFGLENLCIPREEMHTRVREALELVGLWERRQESPNVLSGGQQQLLALAAVLAMRPRLLLLDEALSQLDNHTSEHMLEVLVKLRAAGQSMLFVDHDPSRCNALADREVWL